MKKVICLILILWSAVLFVACDELNNIVLNNMSDLRVNYYEGQNEVFYINLSCGFREQTFAYDGISTNPIECGVITIGYFAECSYKSIALILIVDGEEKEYILEKSPYENVFMEDIGEIIKSENVKARLKNNQDVVELNLVSKNWQIDYKKAANIATNYFKEQLTKLYFNNKLNAECYLKIISKQNFNDKFYYFSIIDRVGNNYSCLVNVATGQIIANNNN